MSAFCIQKRKQVFWAAELSNSLMKTRKKMAPWTTNQSLNFRRRVKFTELEKKSSIWPETVSVPVKIKAYSDQCKLKGERERMPEITRENLLQGPKSSGRQTTPPRSNSNRNVLRNSTLYVHTPKKANWKCSTNSALPQISLVNVA